MRKINNKKAVTNISLSSNRQCFSLIQINFIFNDQSRRRRRKIKNEKNCAAVLVSIVWMITSPTEEVPRAINAALAPNNVTNSSDILLQIKYFSLRFCFVLFEYKIIQTVLYTSAVFQSVLRRRK